MATKEEMEIYRQRYEVFRHLDKLRWQKLQIAVASSSVLLAFGSNQSAKIEWWVTVAVGTILILLAMGMYQIGQGLKKNGAVLRAYGEAVGDNQIPINQKLFGIANFIVLILFLSGVACLGWSALNLLCS